MMEIAIMGKTTIRFPDTLHKKLKELARRERRSMRMQIIYMLEYAMRTFDGGLT